MKYNSIYLFVWMLLVAWMPAVAQTFNSGHIRIENQQIEADNEGQLMVKMNLVLLPALKVSSNHEATLTPVLKAEGRLKQLPSVKVHGRKREIMSRRNKVVAENVSQSIRRQKGKEQTVCYQAQLPYESWMQNAKLLLNEDLCGCCDLVEERKEELVAQLNFPAQELPAEQPVKNQQKIVKKKRVLNGKASLEFPVNQSVIYPEYRNNAAELERIIASIDVIKKDSTVQITAITLHSYASPEGPYSNNVRLARERAEALKEYVRNYYHLSEQLITLTHTPEDWEGLRSYIVSTPHLPCKEQLLTLIDRQGEPDAKHRQLQTLSEGKPYQKLLKECYPALRRTEYTVEYDNKEASN